MPLAFLAVLLPTLFWDRPVDTADALRKAGITRICVPAGQVETWRKLSFTATAFDRAHAAETVAPGVEYHMDVASATRVPWVNANGWRFARDPSRNYFYDVPAGSAALAAAEASAYGVEAVIRARPEDLAPFARMLAFLGEIDPSRLPAPPVMANIGIIDDGSDTMAEVLNLLSRHNLLFRVIPSPDPKYDLNIRLGTPEYPEKAAADPYAFAIDIRHRLTDEKRLVRIYGSNVVLLYLTGDAKSARAHLLNYGQGHVKGLRVRVLGSYRAGKLSAFEHPNASLEDYSMADGAVEFTIPEMGTYAVVDLK